MTIGSRCLAMLASGSLLCVSLPGVAAAQATQVEISGFGFTIFADPGEQFLSDDGILQIRNQHQQAIFFGSLTGIQDVIVNGSIDPVTLEGRSHGVMSFSGTYVSSTGVVTEGSFEGSFAADISPDPSAPCLSHVAVNGNGQKGSAGFAGMKRSFQALNVCGSINYGGYILDPSGQLQP